MLKAVGKVWADLLARLRGIGRRGRSLVVALCAGAALVGLWLATAQPPPEPPTGQGRDAARPRADQPHLGHEAPPAHTGPSKSSSEPITTAADPATVFEALAAASDIWSTQQQSALRWQAAKMAALGRLISSFPGVRQASVLFEPALPRGLGTPAAGATAAVTVTMADQMPVPLSMAQAITELVAGSIAGMRPQDVHVIDGAGRSVSLEPRASQAAAALDQRRFDEAFFADKIRSALGHIASLVVGADVERQDDQPRCRSVALLVPRSYLQGLGDYRQGGQDGEADAAFAAGQLDRIREIVIRVTGLEDAQKVWADWYVDQAAGPPVVADTPTAISRLKPWQAALAGATCAAGAVAILGAVLLKRRRRRAMLRQLRQRHKRLRRGLDGRQGPVRPTLAQVLDRLRGARIAAILGQEHPQVAAVALSRLAPQRAAAVLAQFDAARQAEVMARLAAAGRLAPELVAQIEQALVDRLTDTEHPGPEQAELHAAQVIQQMPSEGQAVLAELGRLEPELAESVRARMAPFEQLLEVPPDRLALSLRQLDERELAVALRAAGKELKDRILSCLPAPASRAVRKRLGRLGPVRLGDIELAQQRVVEAVQSLEAGRYVSAARREVLA